MSELTTTHFLVLSAVVLVCGLMVILTKRNIIYVLIGIELILNAANLNFVVFSLNDPQMTGQIFAVFSVALAAAEITIALAIVLLLVRQYRQSNLDELKTLEY